MPTGATDLGLDVVANQPQTELNYRVLVDTSGTEASLASINAIQQAGGGGRLAFSTDAADGPLAQRMLIDNQGNVGIGTANPGARLDVAGDAKFNGDLSVTGKLTAASFAGNGAGLSNVTPADNSITSVKLAVDSASLSKVTGGKMVISADNVGIGTANPGARLDVAGDAKFNGALNVQGALTVSGVAAIGGDLSVTGKLTAASASVTFDTVIASSLTLTEPDGEEAVKITSEGAMVSPMWKVTQVYVNEQATPTGFFPSPEHTICPPKLIATGGGTLLVFASGSGAALSGVPGPITIGMDLFLDNSRVGSVLSRVDNMTESKPFVTSGLVVPKITPGSHTLTLKAAASTTVSLSDFFNVTILELPFQ
jgi:hypothetical protein